MNSKCCKAPLEVKGDVTKSHICTKCGKDSDPIEWEEMTEQANQTKEKIIKIIKESVEFQINRMSDKKRIEPAREVQAKINLLQGLIFKIHNFIK